MARHPRGFLAARGVRLGSAFPDGRNLRVRQTTAPVAGPGWIDDDRDPVERHPAGREERRAVATRDGKTALGGMGGPRHAAATDRLPR